MACAMRCPSTSVTSVEGASSRSSIPAAPADGAAASTEADDLTEILPRAHDLQWPLVDPCRVQEVGHQPVQPFTVAGHDLELGPLLGRQVIAFEQDVDVPPDHVSGVAARARPRPRTRP